MVGLTFGSLAVPSWAAGHPAPGHTRSGQTDDAWTRAQSQARTTGKPVAVDSLTTPTYQVVANHDGSFTATQSVVPQRAWHDGSWKALDGDLAVDATGAVSPRVSAQGIELSDGGRGPLAVLTDSAGRKLSFTLPFALPAPTLSRDTALYRSVLPGVDLSVTVSAQGGFSDVLVVHDAKAAANPQLKQLAFATSTSGLTVATTAHGGLTAKAADGSVAYAGPAAAMWDSGTASSSAPAARGADRSAGVNTAAQLEVRSSVQGPGRGAKVQRLALHRTAQGIALDPSSPLLNDTSVHYPVFIDPTVNPQPSGTNKLFEAQQGCDYNATDEFTAQTSGEGAGYNGASGCIGSEESFFQINTSNLTKSMVINTSTLTLSKTYSYLHSCTSTQPLTVQQTGVINSSMYWDTRPSAISKIWSGNVKDAYNGAYGDTACGNQTVNVDVTTQITNIAGGGYPTFTFGVYGNESTGDDFTRYAANPYITTTFDLYPTVNSVWISPTPTPTPCGTQGSPGWLGATTTTNGTSNITLGAYIQTYVTGEQATADFAVFDWSLPETNAGNGFVFQSPVSMPVSNQVDASGGGTKVQANIGAQVQDGHSYEWDTTAQTASSQALTSGTSSCYFNVDATPPQAPTVTATDPSFPVVGGGAPNPVGYAGQTMKIGVSSVDKAPAATCTVNSANGNACKASGIDHFIWQFDTQPTTGTGNSATSGVVPVPAASTIADTAGNMTSTATISATVPSWGVHNLYVIAVDKAGNPSQAALDYNFVVPWKTGTAVVPGDLTGDQVPDLLATSASDLYIVPGNNTGAAQTATSFGAGTQSPTGDGWGNYLIAHRGSLTGGAVDDLIAYNKSTGVMYGLKNDADPGGSVSTPGFQGNRSITLAPVGSTKPPCKTTDTTRCSPGVGYDAVGWSHVTQIAMTQDVYGNTSGYGDLITVEANGSMWIYQTGANGLANPVLLGAGDWSNYDLVTPGNASGTSVLWARDRTSGNVYSFNIQANSSGLPPLLSAPNATALVSGVSTSTNRLCLADPAASRTDGTALILWGCDNGPEQFFTLDSDHTVRVLGKCVSTLNNGTGTGTWVDIATCDGSTNQQWTTGANGQLVNAASGLCLADPAATTTTGTKQIIWTCYAGHAEQNWNGGSTAALSTTATAAYLGNFPVSSYPFLVSPGDVNSPTSGPDGRPDLYALDKNGNLTEFFGGAPLADGTPTIGSSYSLGTPFTTKVTPLHLS